MKRPAFQFYPADWRKDVELRSCSVAARGLWIDVLCIAHECEPYGHMTVNGRGMTSTQIAGQVGLTSAQCAKLMQELIDNGVARKTADGVVYSKRMVDDEDLRQRRSEGGKAGSEFGAIGAEHGSKGGRPRKATGDNKPPLEPPLDPPLKPPPSSSSSSSTSVSTPIAPKGAPRSGAVGLKAWVDEIKARNEKPIPPGDPVLAYADKVGIPRDFLVLAWQQFLHLYTTVRDGKRYRDWRKVFRIAIEANWLKLWYLDGQTYSLTTVGHQAQRAHDDRRAA